MKRNKKYKIQLSIGKKEIEVKPITKGIDVYFTGSITIQRSPEGFYEIEVIVPTKPNN